MQLLTLQISITCEVCSQSGFASVCLTKYPASIIAVFLSA
jgi:hypothetical protein